MRFHPKRRASTDHTPGPSSASAAPRTAMRTQIHGFARRSDAWSNPSTASSVPATGVHKPIRRSSPTTISTTFRVASPKEGAPPNSRTPRVTTPIPAVTRSNSKPSPGAPPAKFEKSLRTIPKAKGPQLGEQAQTSEAMHSLERCFLNFDDSALHSNHRGVRAVIRSQFGKNVSHLALHRVFADRQQLRNLFIGIAFGNQAQHADFRRG